MKEYLLMIAGVIVLSTFLTALIPSGKMESIIKSVTKLACLLVIVSPILRFFQTGKLYADSENNSNIIFTQNVIESEASFIQYYCEMRALATQDALEKELQEQFGITSKTCVHWELDGDANDYDFSKNIRILRITVQLSKSIDEEIAFKIKNHIQTKYDCEVTIE